jgi:hypothetical protein
MTSVVEVSPKVAPAPAVSSKAAIFLGVGIAACGAASVATLGLAASIHKEVSDLGESPSAMPASREAGGIFGVENFCHKAKPGSAFDNIDCVNSQVEQAGGDVTMAGTAYTAAEQGTRSAIAGSTNQGTSGLITEPYFKKGLCPVNVHWHLGAEHRSAGQFDENGKGPGDDSHRKLLAGATRLGGRCHHYDSHDPKFTKPYEWKHCDASMKVGETYEVHWPHSALGACGTVNQYQTPFYDGVFCNMDPAATGAGGEGRGEVSLAGVSDFSASVGVQSQTFTIVNDEAYYYPDLMRGMIVDANHGKTVTAYSGSTTGTSRSNTVCSAYGPISWHVDRTCHLISASTFDKMCADMKAQNDDMTDDLYAHGSREVVAQSLTADNKQDISAAYIWGA